jgi:hypothetical protein
VKKSRNKGTPPKASTLTLQLTVPDGAEGPFSLSIKPDGSLVFLDRAGQEVLPESMERSLHYDRSKGPKYQSRLTIRDGKVSIGGVAELARFDIVVVVDTNTRHIDGEDVSAAAFIICRFVPEEGGTRLILDDKRLHIYELHGVAPGKAEMLAILKIAGDIKRSPGASDKRVAFVTDSHLDAHDAIASGLAPIYGDHLIPKNVELLYASPETGQEGLNQLIRFCDKCASDYLNKLARGLINGPSLKLVSEDPAVRYRYMQNREEVNVLNPVVRGPSIGPDTKISLYGRKR